MTTQNNIDEKTPVILIIYKRPDLAKRVISSISSYQPERLYVVADGPKGPADYDTCMETRAQLETINWECDIRTNFADYNMGCGKRVSSGIDWAFNTCDQAIILEDDIIVHPTFFKFCEVLLDYYRDDERIGIISGDCRIELSNLDNSYYFSNFSHIWGWATWKRVWENYDFSMQDWLEIRKSKLLEKKTFSNYYAERYRLKFDKVYSGKTDTWDYQLGLMLWVQNQLSIVPSGNLITNIGFDERATHTTVANKNKANYPQVEMQFPLIHPPNMIINYENDKKDWTRFLGKEPTYFTTTKTQIIRVFCRIINRLKIKNIFRKA
jgi:hypothetical protein